MINPNNHSRLNDRIFPKCGESFLNREDAIEILYIDDDLGDVVLTGQALKRSVVQSNLHIARDGEEAREFLTRVGNFTEAPRPDLIILDLNMPKMDGRQFLTWIKNECEFENIPVVVLTTSESETDINLVYQLKANCCLTKPCDLDEFAEVVRTIELFWMKFAKLPNASKPSIVGPLTVCIPHVMHTSDTTESNTQMVTE